MAYDKKTWMRKVEVRVISEDYPEHVSLMAESFIQTYANKHNFDYTIDINAVPYNVIEHWFSTTAFKFVGTVTVQYYEPDDWGKV